MDKLESTNYVQASIEEFKEGLGWLRTHLPEVGDAYLDFSAACFREGQVSEKNKHLTALAIGVYSQDEYCIMYHADRALNLGATEQELMEIVGVCAAFGGGAALTQGVTIVKDVIFEHTSTSH